MSSPPKKTWLLETLDGEQVFMNTNGKFSLTQDDEYHFAAEFVEGQHPDDDLEKWKAKAEHQLGTQLKLVKGPSWSDDQLHG
jgi:hypothetical protein